MSANPWDAIEAAWCVRAGAWSAVQHNVDGGVERRRADDNGGRSQRKRDTRGRGAGAAKRKVRPEEQPVLEKAAQHAHDDQVCGGYTPNGARAIDRILAVSALEDGAQFNEAIVGARAVPRE